MGHVPPGPVPPEGAGPDLPGRQHRGAGAPRATLRGRPLGRLGEDVAAGFLRARGATLVARNPHQGRGEIDLLARIGREMVAVEVKTRRAGGSMDPAEAFDPAKAARVRKVAAGLRPPAFRVDLVTVVVGDEGVTVRWVPRAG
ncbi:MAG: YraN family protein [Acidimicrobiia bacterium]